MKTSFPLRLSFHSHASKRAFVRQNKIHAKEILAETTGSITLNHVTAGQADWKQSAHVYSVTKVLPN
jgi:hypothetical protein